MLKVIVPLLFLSYLPLWSFAASYNELEVTSDRARSGVQSARGEQDLLSDKGQKFLERARAAGQNQDASPDGSTPSPGTGDLGAINHHQYDSEGYNRSTHRPTTIDLAQRSHQACAALVNSSWWTESLFFKLYQVRGKRQDSQYYQGYGSPWKELFDDSSLKVGECIQASLKCMEELDGIRFQHNFTSTSLADMAFLFDQLIKQRKTPRACHSALLEPIKRAQQDCYEQSKTIPIVKYTFDHDQFENPELEQHKLTGVLCEKHGTKFYDPTQELAASSTASDNAELASSEDPPQDSSDSDESAGTAETDEAEDLEGSEQVASETDEPVEGSEDEANNGLESGDFSQEDIDSLVDSMSFASKVPRFQEVSNSNSIGTSNIGPGSSIQSGASGGSPNFNPATNIRPLEQAQQYAGSGQLNNNGNSNAGAAAPGPGAVGAPGGFFGGGGAPNLGGGGTGGQQASRPRSRRGSRVRASGGSKYYSPSPTNLSYSPSPKEKKQVAKQAAIANQTLAEKKFDPKTAARMISQHFQKGMQKYIIENQPVRGRATPTIFQEINFHYSIDGRNQPRRFLNSKGR